MHVDLNSCFASVEQQANPLYRGRPVAVGAYTSGNGCILAASREAKVLGIKTGMRVADGRSIYPRLIVLPPDPPKYRAVNKALFQVLSSYTPDISNESIDEMVLKIPVNHESAIMKDAQEIKKRITHEIGEWLTVSIGVSTNRYLAKVASELHKPDGLDVIDGSTIETIFMRLQLEDLTGIKAGNASRLRFAGIATPSDFLAAPADVLKRAFRSITGYQWWARLHGYDDGQWGQDALQKSFGQSFAMGHAHTPQEGESRQILTQLILKMGRRMRADGFTARGLGVSCFFRDHSGWSSRYIQKNPLFADYDLYSHAVRLLSGAPAKQIRILAVWTYQLTKTLYTQESLLEGDQKQQRLTQALDTIADRWGEFTVTPGRMIAIEQKVLDRIAFGR